MKQYFILLGISFAYMIYAENKHFVVTICSYNNQAWVMRNLESVFCQDYEDWEIIFLNDNSSDATLFKAQEHAKKRGFEHKITFIDNKTRMLAMANQFYAVHWSKNSDIIVILDGDDWFSCKDVLSHLNAVYQDPNIWMTYGSYRNWPAASKEVWDGWIKKFGSFGALWPVPGYVIKENAYRKVGGMSSPIRSFYVWLFKNIRIEDFVYNGEFLPMACDCGIMLPLFELAGGRFSFIKKVMYIYNTKNPINDHKVDVSLQYNIDKHIRQLKPYQRLEDSNFAQFENLSKETLIIITANRETGSYTEDRSVIYSDELNDFTADLKQKLIDSSSNYILICDNPYVLSLDLELCLTKLIETHAHIFFLTDEKIEEKTLRITDNIYGFVCDQCGAEKIRKQRDFIINKNEMLALLETNATTSMDDVYNAILIQCKGNNIGLRLNTFKKN